jgi:hypothetical protein
MVDDWYGPPADPLLLLCCEPVVARELSIRSDNVIRGNAYPSRASLAVGGFALLAALG